MSASAAVDVRALAGYLNDNSQRGDYPQCLIVLRRLAPKDAQDVLLRAGFSTVGVKHRPDFWKHAIGQLRAASTARQTGWELNARPAA